MSEQSGYGREQPRLSLDQVGVLPLPVAFRPVKIHVRTQTLASEFEDVCKLTLLCADDIICPSVSRAHPPSETPEQKILPKRANQMIRSACISHEAWWPVANKTRVICAKTLSSKNALHSMPTTYMYTRMYRRYEELHKSTEHINTSKPIQGLPR